MAVAAGEIETALLAAVIAPQPGLAESLGTTGQDVMTDLPLAGVEGVSLAVLVQRLSEHSGEA